MPESDCAVWQGPDGAGRLHVIWTCPFPGCESRFVQIGSTPRLTITPTVIVNATSWRLVAINDCPLPAVGICPACAQRHHAALARLDRRMQETRCAT